MPIYREELTPEQISQNARIQQAKIILNKKKQNLDKRLNDVEKQNDQKEERLKQSVARVNDDIKNLSSSGQSVSAMTPTNESMDQTLSQRFFSDRTGHIIDYLVNKSPASREVIELATALKKDKEFSSIISKIRSQIKMEQPNESLLTVLKSKVNTRIQNYEEI